MTNILAAALLATIISVTETNWAVIGDMQINNTTTSAIHLQNYMVERGTRWTNTWIVIPWYGSNHWQFMSSVAGETLPELRLIAKDEPTLRQPPPLPTNSTPRPTFRETGIVIIK